MHEYIGLIKAYTKSGTYFVRKISAQALLPLISFDDYILEIKECLDRIEKHMSSPKYKLRQNEAHGVMVRLDIFLHAYYTYRDLNHQISGRSDDEENDLIKFYRIDELPEIFKNQQIILNDLLKFIDENQDIISV